MIPNFKGPAEVAALRARAEEIMGAVDPSAATGIFSTRAESMHRDGYFRESATSIRCFFEEEAFDEAGRLRVPKPLAINAVNQSELDKLLPPKARRTRGPNEVPIVSHRTGRPSSPGGAFGEKYG